MSTTMVPCPPITDAQRGVLIAAKYWRETCRSKTKDVEATIRAHHSLMAALCVLDYSEQQHDPTAGDPDSEIVAA
jgi:hypothetical protein